MAFFEKLKNIFKQNPSDDLWVAPEVKEHKHIKKDSVEEINTSDCSNEYSIFGPIANENIDEQIEIPTPTVSPTFAPTVSQDYTTGIDTYSIMFDNNVIADFRKHIIYISSRTRDNNLTTQFIIQMSDMVRYNEQYLKIAIERAVYKECEYHEKRVDYVRNYKVNPDIKLQIVNDIFKDYKSRTCDSKKKYIEMLNKNKNHCGGYAGPYCGG